MEQHPNDNHPPLSVWLWREFLAVPLPGAEFGAVSVSSRAVVIAIHDEHGGFWDHVPPILQFIAECLAPGGGTYSNEVDLRTSFGFSSVSASR